MFSRTTNASTQHSSSTLSAPLPVPAALLPPGPGSFFFMLTGSHLRGELREWLSSGSTHSPLFPLSLPLVRFFGLVFLVLTLPSATPLPPATALLSPTTSRRCHDTCHSTLKLTIVLVVAALYCPGSLFTFCLTRSHANDLPPRASRAGALFSLSDVSSLCSLCAQSSRSSPTSSRSTTEHPLYLCKYPSPSLSLAC
jgi:hypothetical protein